MSADIDTRTAYTQGLRALADLLDAHPDVPLPYDGKSAEITVFTTSPQVFATIADALDGVTEGAEDARHYDYAAHGALAGLKVGVSARAADVAERCVVGTVEKVEWRRRTPEQHDRLLAAVEATEHDREKADAIRASYRNITDPDSGRLTHIDGGAR